MTNSIQQYKDAVEAWSKAVDELDQAHAVLRDVGMQDFSVRHGGTWISADQMVDRAMSLLAELRTATCDDCGSPLATHSADCPYWTE